MITVRCDCGKTISVAAEHRGKRIKCKNCGRELLVPARWPLSARVGAALTLGAIGYLAAICVLVVMLWRFSDAWGPATVLLFISRWPFLLPLIVLLPAAIYKSSLTPTPPDRFRIGFGRDYVPEGMSALRAWIMKNR